MEHGDCAAIKILQQGINMGTNQTVFNNGVPTEIDVRKLMEKYGVPAQGQRISKNEVSGIIGVPVGSNRYLSIVTAWRKKLDRESNVIFKVVNGSFVVADPSTRIDMSGAGMKHALRKVRRSGGIAARTDRDGLTAEQMRTQDHIVSVSVSLLQMSAVAARKLKYPEPTKQVSA